MMKQAMIIAIAALSLAACSKTEGGLTFKDGDFECSRGESRVEFKPGELVGGVLGQVMSVPPGLSATPSLPDMRTKALEDRAKLCADFLSSASQD